MTTLKGRLEFRSPSYLHMPRDCVSLSEIFETPNIFGSCYPEPNRGI